MSKMKILSNHHERVFKSIPKFSKRERSVYLLPDAGTNRTLSRFKSPEAKVGYLLNRAYFQAKGRFFSLDKASKVDKRAAEKILGIKTSVDLGRYTAKMSSYHRNLILSAHSWKPYDNEKLREALEEHASFFVDKQPAREELLFSLLDYCWLRRIEIPSYTELSIIVSNSFKRFDEKIKNLLQKHITDTQRDALLSLINDPELYLRFQQLKTVNQATSQRDMNRAAEELDLFKSLFFQIEPLVEKLELTHDALKHFSKTVTTTTLTGLRRLKDRDDVAVKLLGFTQEQYITRNDAAVASILKYMREWGNKGTNREKEIKEREEEALHGATEAVANCAKTAEHIINEAESVAGNQQITDGEKITKITALIKAYRETTKPNMQDHIAAVSNGLENNKKKINRYKFLFEKSMTLQKSVSPLLKLLVFDEDNSDPKVYEAIKYFVDTDGNVTKDQAPTAFMSPTERSLLTSQMPYSFRERYKVLLFIHVENGIRGKRLNLLYSNLYQVAHKLQISDKQWNDEYEDFLRRSELEKYRDGKAVLELIGKKVSKSIVRINEQYFAGENEMLSVKNDKWSLETSEADFDSTQFIPSLLKGSKKVLLYKTLAELDDELHFSDEFALPDQIGAMTSVEKKYIYGVIISLGTNIGHHELSRSSELSEKTLRDLDMKRFSIEKLEKVLKIVVKRIHSLDLPTIYDDEQDIIYSSSDGRKIVVAVDSLLANYSYKYYGKEQGISVNSFVDHRQSIFHVNVFSSSDREAAYMMDGLALARENLYEEAQADPFMRALDDEVFSKKTHRHSTDTFGYTDAIFSGLFFLSVSFAPRMKNIEDSALYGYERKDTKQQSGYPIAPNYTINKKLIIDNWDNILRLMATIKLGYASASTLFRMLSAKGDSTLYKALKEFGRLLKTQFIYSYIENEDLRRNIQKQLNRAELSQKFHKAVFHGRKGELKVAEHEQIKKAATCTTILQSIIVMWNYLYLQRHMMEIKSVDERRKFQEHMAGGSVIAWAHFNMAGTYDFDHLDADSFGIPLSRLFKAKVTI